MSETPSPEEAETRPRPVDVAVAASTLALGAVRRTADVVRPVVRPVVGVALRPPLVPTALQPQTWLDSLGQSGADQREAIRAALQQRLSDVLDVIVPLVIAEVVKRIDLTSLVISQVDIEQIVAQVDPNAVAARVNVNAVSERVDLDAIVERLDLTEIVLEQVDLEAVINAALDRVDMLELATEVIDGVDLPSIIRDSTGAMASDAVREVRLHGIAADQAIGRAMDRLLFRRGDSAKQQRDQTDATTSTSDAADADASDTAADTTEEE